MLKVWIFFFGGGALVWVFGEMGIGGVVVRGCGKGLCEGCEGVFDSEVSTREVAGKGYALNFWSVAPFHGKILRPKITINPNKRKKSFFACFSRFNTPECS